MKTLFTILFCIGISCCAFSQLQPTGFIPGSGFTANIYANDSVVLSSIGGRLFRSVDNGQNWHQVLEGLGPGVLGSRTIEAADGVLLLASNDREKLYRSFDNGASWEPANDGIENYLQVETVNQIASSSGNIFIGHNFMLRHSTDQGESWQSTDLTNSCTALQYLDGEIWVGQDDDIYYSQNHGGDWSTLFSDPNIDDAAQILCFGKKGDSLLVGLSYDPVSALYYTGNNGADWEELGSFDNVSKIYNGDGYMLVLSLGAIYKSVDDGMSWEQLQEAQTGCFDFSVVDDEIWASTTFGPKRIDISGESSFSPEISLGQVNELDHIGESLFCLANFSYFRSMNNGETWEDITGNVSLSGHAFTDLQIEGELLLAIERNQSEFAAISDDSGETFEEIPLTPHGTAAHLISDGRLISFSYLNNTFWYSDDTGQNWESATSYGDNIDGFDEIKCIENVQGKLCAGFEGGVAVALNNGEHWNFYDHPEYTFLSLAGWPEKLIAIAKNMSTNELSILKSTNDGESWTEAESGFAPNSDEIAPFRLAMLNGRVYCANGTSPFSEDAGKTYALDETGNWFEVTEFGILPMEMQSITETNYGIFVGLNKLGVWFTEDVAFGIEGVHESESTLNLYPNPAQKIIQIDTKVTGDYAIRNVNGQLVQFGKMPALSQTLNISTLQKGMYFFTLRNGEEVLTKRFVVD